MKKQVSAASSIIKELHADNGRLLALLIDCKQHILTSQDVISNGLDEYWADEHQYTLPDATSLLARIDAEIGR